MYSTLYLVRKCVVVVVTSCCLFSWHWLFACKTCWLLRWVFSGKVVFEGGISLNLLAILLLSLTFLSHFGTTSSRGKREQRERERERKRERERGMLFPCDMNALQLSWEAFRSLYLKEKIWFPSPKHVDNLLEKHDSFGWCWECAFVYFGSWFWKLRVIRDAYVCKLFRLALFSVS